MKKLIWLTLGIVLFLGIFMRLIFVEPAGFPDRTSIPLLQEPALELVAELDLPPANIAVNKQDRIFVTLHPEAKPWTNLGEIVEGQFVAWPFAEPKSPEQKWVNDAYAIRFDSRGVLWVLDNYPARLLAIDIETKAILREFVFSSKTFPLASHANDFQVSPDNKFIYISDDGLFNRRPGIVVYDIDNNKAWRHLDNHYSVKAGDFTPVVQGVEMTLLGLFSINPGVDGLALDRKGEWLYYASFSSLNLYRVATKELNTPHSSPQDQVQIYSQKTFTDGMSSDMQGNVYLSDIENSAIVRVTSERQLETLVRSDKLRWPDGFSFDDKGYLYVTCSSLHQVILHSKADIKSTAPYHIYKIKVAEQSIAGH